VLQAQRIERVTFEFSGTVSFFLQITLTKCYFASKTQIHKRGPREDPNLESSNAKNLINFIIKVFNGLIH